MLSSPMDTPSRSDCAPCPIAMPPSSAVVAGLPANVLDPPMATVKSPLACEPSPMAIASSPSALAFLPQASAVFSPLSVAPSVVSTPSVAVPSPSVSIRHSAARASLDAVGTSASAVAMPSAETPIVSVLRSELLIVVRPLLAMCHPVPSGDIAVRWARQTCLRSLSPILDFSWICWCRTGPVNKGHHGPP